MLNIVLYEPEIPFNTGAAIRLCANTGFDLHLIEPIAFDLDDKKLRRAGLDYHEYAQLKIWPALDNYQQQYSATRLFACTTHGQTRPDHCAFKPGDTLLFGPETRGLPKTLIESLPEQQRVRIPMRPDSRSMNLANSIAIMVYEAWRQLDFAGAR